MYLQIGQLFLVVIAEDKDLCIFLFVCDGV